MTSKNKTSKDKVWRIAGLAVVGIAYIGGLIGWTWAVRSVPEDDGATQDSTSVVINAVPSMHAGAVPVSDFTK